MSSALTKHRTRAARGAHCFPTGIGRENRGHAWAIEAACGGGARAGLAEGEEDEPIWRRTRTRLPLAHVALDDLEGLLGEEPEDELFDEEGHEYQQFLRVWGDPPRWHLSFLSTDLSRTPCFAITLVPSMPNGMGTCTTPNLAEAQLSMPCLKTVPPRNAHARRCCAGRRTTLSWQMKTMTRTLSWTGKSSWALLPL